MAALLEPPPLLSILLVVGAAALAIWWGIGFGVSGRRRRESVTAAKSEEAERWAADDPALPQKQPYAYRPPPPAPAPSPPLLPRVSPVPAPAAPVPAPTARDEAATSSQTEHLEVSLAGFFAGGSRARSRDALDGEVQDPAPAQRPDVGTTPAEAVAAPRDPEASVRERPRPPAPE